MTGITPAAAFILVVLVLLLAFVVTIVAIDIAQRVARSIRDARLKARIEEHHAEYWT